MRSWVVDVEALLHLLHLLRGVLAAASASHLISSKNLRVAVEHSVRS